jgi:hypothetical protein
MYFKRRYGLRKLKCCSSFISTEIFHKPEIDRKAFKEFIRINRMKGIKSTEFQGIAFLNEIQELIIKLYRIQKWENYFPMVTQSLSDFGIALTRNSELHSLKLRKC